MLGSWCGSDNDGEIKRGKRWSEGKKGSGSEIKIPEKTVVGVKCLITAGLWLSGEASVRAATKMESKQWPEVSGEYKFIIYFFIAPSLFRALRLRAHLFA